VPANTDLRDRKERRKRGLQRKIKNTPEESDLIPHRRGEKEG